MKLCLVTLLVFVFLFLVTSVSTASSCKKRAQVCRGSDECCPVAGTRMVCAPSREICDKTKCCITEIEEQQEKQATLFGTRSFKRFLKRLLDGDEE